MSSYLVNYSNEFGCLQRKKMHKPIFTQTRYLLKCKYISINLPQQKQKSVRRSHSVVSDNLIRYLLQPISFFLKSRSLIKN